MESKNSLPLQSTKASLSFFDEKSSTDAKNIVPSTRFWKKNGTPFSVKDEPEANGAYLYLLSNGK